MANTVLTATELAKPIIEKMGLELWDVRFEKEGSNWYLRYYIDKPGGVNIQDCENFSRAIDPILDEKDPIAQSYCLEVSSPGVERELIRPEHFLQNIGKKVKVKYIRAQDGIKEFTGVLKDYNEKIITIDDKQTEKNIIANIRLVDDFDYKKGANT